MSDKLSDEAILEQDAMGKFDFGNFELTSKSLFSTKKKAASDLVYFKLDNFGESITTIDKIKFTIDDLKGNQVIPKLMEYCKSSFSVNLFKNIMDNKANFENKTNAILVMINNNLVVESMVGGHDKHAMAEELDTELVSKLKGVFEKEIFELFSSSERAKKYIIIYSEVDQEYCILFQNEDFKMQMSLFKEGDKNKMFIKRKKLRLMVSLAH